MPVLRGKTACLKCLCPEPPRGAQPTCETAGVLGPVTAAIASLQVSAAMRILCGLAPVQKITTIDVWTGEIRQLSQPSPDTQCAACGRRDFVPLNPRTRPPVTCRRNNHVHLLVLPRPP